MTPFRIRERLRRLAAGRRVEAARFPVTFVLPDGTERTVEAEEHYTLVMASQVLPKPILTGCPDGSCGTCRVEVIEGDGLAPPRPKELEVIREFVKDANERTRLACHARITGPGVKVRVFELYDLDAMTTPRTEG